MKLPEGSYQLRFMSFFDWSQLAVREYGTHQVLVERLDGRPELVERLALIELKECSIWLAQDLSDKAETDVVYPVR